MDIQQIPQEWIDAFNELSNKGLLKPSVNYDVLFSLPSLYGKPLHTLNLGNIAFPTGRIVACDPLVALPSQQDTYVRTITPGIYPVQVKVAEFDTNYYRYVAARVVLKDTTPVHYEMALQGNEDLSVLDGESYIGFKVDAGLATIVDEATIKAYQKFVTDWYAENPNGNMYDDYLSHFFRLNAIANPKYQREAGDWLLFNIPNTNLTVPMIQSGFGDGLYPVYWAFDEHSELCQIIIEFIDCGEKAE